VRTFGTSWALGSPSNPLQAAFASGLFRDPKTAADPANRLALHEANLRLAQGLDDLLGRFALPCHSHISAREVSCKLTISVLCINFEILAERIGPRRDSALV